MSAVALVLILLGAAAAVRVVAERFDIPHPALLVLGGLALAVAPGLPRATLDPDVVSSSREVPELAFVDQAAEIRVRAVPKKPEARGGRAAQIVGNPEPVLVGWS